MTDDTKIRRSHTRLWIEAAIGVVVLAAAIALVWYVRSPRFADLVRRKTIATLEEVTGGRVELHAFRWNLSKLEFEADDLTIHGLEAPDQQPYAHADRIHVRLHIISFVEKRISLKELSLDRPVVHLIVNPDGTTNAAEPKLRSHATPVQQLFDLAIARLDLHNGLLLVNDRALPLDFAADDVTAAMTYDRGDHRYDASVQAGKMDVKYQDFRDVAARGEVAFSLWSNRLQIKSLNLTSENSSLQATGKLSNFNSPELDFKYSSAVDVAQLGSVIRLYELRGGRARLDGSGTYSSTTGVATRGYAAARGVTYLDNGVEVRDVGVSADFSLARDNLALTRIAGRLLGGGVTGDAEVRNLLSGLTRGMKPSMEQTTERAKPGAKQRPNGRKSAFPPISGPGLQQGTAHLRVTGLSLTELARMFSTKAVPYEKLNPVGSVGGTVNLAWTRSVADASADLALDVTPPAQPSANQLPVTATVRARYNPSAQVMDFSALTMTTPHSHLNATGILGSTSAALHVVLNTTSLTEFQPLLTAMGSPPLPVELAGGASFNGTLSGRLKDPQIVGHVQASDFTYIYMPTVQGSAPLTQAPAKKKSLFHFASTPPPPPQSTAQPRRIHLDQFSGDVQYSSTGVALHHGIIQEGKAHLEVDGSATLAKGSFTENLPFQVQAAIRDADVAELQRAAGLNYPVTGTLNFTGQAAGTEANPHGSGHFSLLAGQAYGRPVKSLTANLAFANHEAQLDDIRMQAMHGELAGSAAYNFGNKQVRFDLTGENIDLANVPELQMPHLQVGGVGKFTAKGSGVIEQPLINAHVQVSGLMLNGDRLGGVTADAVTHGYHLQLTARSNFPAGSLAVDGGIELRGDMPSDLKLEFSGLDINPFLPAEVRQRVTHRTSLAGHAELSGPLKQPRLLNGKFNLDQFAVEVEKVAITSDGPVELVMANEVVTVQRCTLASGDSRFTLTGSASLKDDRRLTLRANGHVDLNLVHTLDPEVSSYGISNLDLTVNGPMAQPAISGRIDIQHGGLSMIDLPAGLGDINGSLVFNQDRLEVEHLTARTGGGLVTFGGFITYGRTVGFNLTASGTEIRFRYAGISVTADESLRLVGTLQSSILSGDVTVTRFAQIPSSDLTFALAQVGPAPIAVANSPLNNLRLDVRILSTPELTVQTALAKLAGDVDLRLRGTAARPVLLGRINIAEGDIKLAGAKYHLERGDITFSDPVRIDPVLDIEASTRVRDYDITIGLHGTLERLNTTYRSDPPLSSEDIVALLAFGRTQQESAMNAAPQSGFAESASGALLGQAINQAVSNRVSRIFGVSSIRINPSLGGPDNNPNARVTFEQQVSNNVTLTYITNLTRSAQQVIQFEYNINSEYTVEAIRDENGVVSFDVLIRKRKR
ncbi:MAG: translocation/assembly module TamB domain-containing protein [Candidatus Korobacteraceae bacterium]